MKTTMPTAVPDETFDSTVLDGVTLAITDRNGVVYQVTIPALL